MERCPNCQTEPDLADYDTCERLGVCLKCLSEREAAPKVMREMFKDDSIRTSEEF